RPAPGFELARREAAARRGLEAELAERHLGAARGDAGVAALLLFSVFGSCGLQHDYSFFSPSGFSGFLPFLTVVFGAGAPSFFGAAARGRAGPPRFAPGRGAGFLARFGSAGASGSAAVGPAPAAARRLARPPWGPFSP